jgi:hypothetical protein
MLIPFGEIHAHLHRIERIDAIAHEPRFCPTAFSDTGLLA